MPQSPAVQLGVALAAAGHALPQVPQWPASLWSAWQAPEQKLVGGAQTAIHAPAEQVVPAAHAALHAPQWALSVASVTSHPFAGSPSQFANPVWHAPRPHAPAEQAAAEWARAAHACRQAPQWAAEASSGVSQPLAASPSQSP
jgi:hypothetical protein